MRYPQQVVLTPSRYLLALVAAIHLVAAIAFLLSSIPGPVQTATLLALAASAWQTLRREWARNGHVLILEDSGLMGVSRGEPGLSGSAMPLPGCTDFGWAVWLQWQWADRPRRRGWTDASAMLLPDSMNRDAWRSLRIWLRHKAARGTDLAAGP